VWFSRKGPKPSADGVKGKVISGKGTRECRYAGRPDEAAKKIHPSTSRLSKPHGHSGGLGQRTRGTGMRMEEGGAGVRIGMPMRCAVVLGVPLRRADRTKGPTQVGRRTLRSAARVAHGGSLRPPSTHTWGGYCKRVTGVSFGFAITALKYRPVVTALYIVDAHLPRGRAGCPCGTSDGGSRTIARQS